MNRWTVLKVLAPTLALVAAMAPAPASAIGGPAGGFVIPAGTVADFTGADFAACNNLSWGYQLNLGPELVQATRQGDCVNHMPAPNVSIGPFATPMTLRIFMRDNTCNFTYHSDGTPVDHVIISGSNPYLVRFADAGGFCERKLVTLNTFTLYNFKVTLTLTDLCKVEDMNSQLDLNCEQEGQNGGAHEGDGSAGNGGAHEGDGGAGNGNHGDSSVETLKATPVEHESSVKVTVKVSAKVSAGKVEHANHGENEGQQSKSNHDS